MILQPVSHTGSWGGSLSGTSLISNRTPLEAYKRPIPKVNPLRPRRRDLPRTVRAHPCSHPPPSQLKQRISRLEHAQSYRGTSFIKNHPPF